MNVLIMYLSNNREHVVLCQCNSLIHTNATHPLRRWYISTNFVVAPLFTLIRCVVLTTIDEVAWSFTVLCETQAAKHRNYCPYSERTSYVVLQ